MSRIEIIKYCDHIEQYHTDTLKLSSLTKLLLNLFKVTI